MKVFRHKNGFLYTIEQKGMGRTITPPENWWYFHAIPHYTNKKAPDLPQIGEIPDLKDFTLEFEE